MRNRKEVILPYIKGKRVLDCGGAQELYYDRMHARGDWLHDLVRENASYALGLDILEDQVKYIAEKGYNFRCMDVERMEFKQEFDVVLGGEIIEHLSAPGLFLDCAYRALTPAGIIILTTPNIYSLTLLSKYLVNKKEGSRCDHVGGYSPALIEQFLVRHKFEIAEIALCKRGAKNKFIEGVRDTIGFFLPHLAETIVIVGRKPQTLNRN